MLILATNTTFFNLHTHAYNSSIYLNVSEVIASGDMLYTEMDLNFNNLSNQMKCFHGFLASEKRFAGFLNCKQTKGPDLAKQSVIIMLIYYCPTD